MPHRTFLAFILPSIVAMLLFIALPIVSVIVQSLYVEHEKVLVTVENSQPFGGCTTETKAATACGHCGKTSCSATCTAHKAADSTWKGR